MLLPRCVAKAVVLYTPLIIMDNCYCVIFSLMYSGIQGPPSMGHPRIVHGIPGYIHM